MLIVYAVEAKFWRMASHIACKWKLEATLLLISTRVNTTDDLRKYYSELASHNRIRGKTTPDVQTNARFHITTETNCA